MRNVLRHALLGLIGIGVVSPALSADYTWQGGDGLYADPAMWSPTGVPGLDDNARLNASSAGSITWTGSSTNASLIASAIGGKTLVLDLAGNTYTLTNRFYFDGSQASSYLVVSNGYLSVPTNICDVKINAGVAPASLTFANGATATLYSLYSWRSSVNVETGADLTCNGEVKIGDSAGSGAVNILAVNGGNLTLNNNLWVNGGNNSTSILNIAGGSVVAKKYFSIGNGGSGTAWGVLNLSGGYLETQADVWLGNASSTRGEANISGGIWTPKGGFEVAHGGYTVSRLNMSGGEIFMPTSGKNFIVANNGNGNNTTGTVSVVGGTITVTNNASFNIGSSANGLGRVFLGGTGYIHTRDFRVGNVSTSRGECIITGGLLVAENYIGVGPNSGSDGYMLIDGGDVFAPQIKVGDSAGGNGCLTLSNGTVFTSGKFTVGGSGTGTCYIAGGSLAMSNDFSLGASAGGTGTVYMTDGSVLTTNSLKVGDWGGKGAFELRGGAVTTVASLTVGNGNGSAGVLTVAGGRLLSRQNAVAGNNGQNGAWGAIYVTGGELIASNAFTLGSSTNTWGNAFVSGGYVEGYSYGIGASGEGHWSQSGGTTLVRQNITVGDKAGATGSVAVADGEMTVRGSATIGNYGNGALSVSGGKLTITGGLTVGNATNSAGLMTLAGGVTSANGGNWGNWGVTQVEISGGTNTFTSQVNIGVYTQATAVISGGSNTFTGVGVARNYAGSSATLTVTGGKTFIPNGYLDIGQFGKGVLEVSGGELTTAFLRINPGTTASPVPPQSEIRISGGRLMVTNTCYMPDTTSITGRLTLTGGELVVPVLRQHWGKLNVLFDGGEVEAYKTEPDFIRELDVHALTANGLAVDSAGFAIGTALALPDADGQHGRLIKRGLGTFTLNAATTFTGPLAVEAGTLALGTGGLVTLAGGCTVNGGALLNLSARTLDFTLPAGTLSRVDGELRLASGKTLTVASGATLSGTGVVGRVVLESGATLARDAADGAAQLHASELVIPAGATLALTGYTLEDLKNGIAIATADTLSVAHGNAVSVTLDGAQVQTPVALRTSGGALTAVSYNAGLLIKVQ